MPALTHVEVADVLPFFPTLVQRMGNLLLQKLPLVALVASITATLNPKPEPLNPTLNRPWSVWEKGLVFSFLRVLNALCPSREKPDTFIL